MRKNGFFVHTNASNIFTSGDAPSLRLTTAPKVNHIILYRKGRSGRTTKNNIRKKAIDYLAFSLLGFLTLGPLVS